MSIAVVGDLPSSLLLCREPFKLIVIDTMVSGLAAYSGTTELLQHFVSARSPEWSDWLQDLAGIAIGTAIWGMAAIARHRWTQHVDPAQ